MTLLAAPAVFAAHGPDAARLGNWLQSWTQPSGAIHGFHNHSVWGDNPYRYQDMTAGHSTFASPLLPALAQALKNRPDARATSLLEKLIDFQCQSLQADGQFAHIGFQAGDTLKFGLVHNMVPSVALAETVRILGDSLNGARRGKVRDVLRDTVFPACDRLYGVEVGSNSTANQEYVRIWALLEHMLAFNHRDWDARVRRDLDRLMADYHVANLPDKDSAGCLRSVNLPDLMEPAEYYGLMIAPLMLASKHLQQPKYQAAALSLSRHVVRSSWKDAHAQRRFHRMWYRVGGKWRKMDEPMLIGGMGITLAALQNLARETKDAEIERFLNEMDATYKFYQHQAGFFLAASGWENEADIIPSSAWQSHDFYHLVRRWGTDENFWSRFWEKPKQVAVVLSPGLIWMEDATHWTVRGYFAAHGLELAGRKDAARFYVDIPAWMNSGREAPAHFLMPDQPRFVRVGTDVFQTQGRRDLTAMETRGLNLVATP